MQNKCDEGLDRPLSRLVVKGYANNEITIVRASEPRRKRNGADSDVQRLESRRVAVVNALEILRKASQKVTGNYCSLFIPLEEIRGSRKWGGVADLPVKLSPCRQDKNAWGLIEYYPVEEVQQEIERLENYLKELNRQNQSTASLPPLDIPNDLQDRTLVFGDSTPQRSPGLTRYAHHSILESGAVMERHFGNHAAFITLTIPGSTKAAFKCVADNSSWLIGRLYQRVRDKRHWGEIGWYYAWELQERGALHAHICLAAHPHQISKRKLMSLAHDIEGCWFDLLLELKDKTGVDCFERAVGGTWRNNPEVWQSKVEWVKKSIAGYLAKYVAKEETDKQKKIVKRLGKNVWFPSQWWGSSGNIKALVKQLRFRYEIPYGIVEDYHEIDDILTDLIISSEPITANNYEWEVKRKGRVVCWGVTQQFYFCPIAYTQIHAAFKDLQPVLETLVDELYKDQRDKYFEEQDNLGFNQDTGEIYDYDKYIRYTHWKSCQEVNYTDGIDPLIHQYHSRQTDLWVDTMEAITLKLFDNDWMSAYTKGLISKDSPRVRKIEARKLGNYLRKTQFDAMFFDALLKGSKKKGIG